MYDLKEIANRVQNGIYVTTDEYLFLLQNSDAALWGFIIANNPGNINNTLRHQLGYIELGFNPDVKAIAAQIEMMIKKGEYDEIAVVTKNWTFKNPENFDPSFVNAINQLVA